MKSFFEVLGAAGLHEPRDLKAWYVMRRVSSGDVRSYNEIYPPLEPGALLTGGVNSSLARAWATARADTFNPPFATPKPRTRVTNGSTAPRVARRQPAKTRRPAARPGA